MRPFALVCGVSMASLLLACSSDPAAPVESSGGSGGQAGSTASGAGGMTPTSGSSMGGGGAAPLAGGGGSGSGSGGGGAGGAGGSAGGSGGGGEGPVVFGKLHCPTSTEGNGVHMTTAMQPPEWKLGAGVTPGTVTNQAELTSQTYGGYKFPYRIYTSANYVKGQPALLLVFGDGGMYLDGGYQSRTVLDNLTAEGAIPPVVGLFVDPGNDRVNIYDPPTDKYATFLTGELIPQVILDEYSVSRDPNAWATVGYSASGEAGFAVVWHRPEQFHVFFGHSASFGASIRYDNWVWADKIAQAPKRELRVSLAVAAQGDLTDDRGSWRTINENVAKALEAKGNPYRLVIGPGDHGGQASREDFPNALRWMWKGCTFAP